MATATKMKRGQVTEALVARIAEIHDFLNLYNIERKEQIDLALMCMIGGIDGLFIGPPGTGKTWMLELMLLLVDDADQDDLFSTLVFKETPADDILGPRSLPAMKEGRIERLMDGFLPRSRMGYLDEIFKASPTLVNALLDLLANRKLKVGANVHDCSDLLVIYGSSNELPDREDMLPFRDRWGVTNIVPPVKAPENRRKVLEIQDAYQANARTLDLSDAPRITLDEITQARQEARMVELPSALLENIVKAEEKWEGHGFLPSQRRMGQIIMGLKTRAWMRGAGEASTDDMIVAQHMAWNHPDDADAAREVVLEFANAFARKAARMKEALEPILTEMDRVKREVQTAGTDQALIEAQMEDAFKVMRDLRRLKREASDQITQGEQAGHDVDDLKAVLGEITRANEWVTKTFAEDD